MFERRAPPRDPVTISLDGAEIVAERGEPLAVTLLGAGEARIARSPKLHRARGPYCLRGDCDGCLARVGGEPNVMTCMRAATGGEELSTQNVLGSKDTDLLRVTDWFFPKGIDHHHLLAGIPGVSEVMQSFARRMAGIGRLPSAVVAPRPATRASCDVLVVGGGLSGVAAASALSARGLDVRLVDDGPELGGSARAAGGAALEALRRLPIDKVTVDLRSTVAGVYEREALVVTHAGAVVVSPRVFVLATGAHDGVIAAPNNDLPGVMSARAVCLLDRHGLRPKGQVAIVGEGFWADQLGARLADRVAVRLALEEVESIRGSKQVKAIVSKAGVTTKVSVVAIDAPPAPSFEIAQSMGASVRAAPGGYAVETEGGLAAPDVYAIGECRGAPFSPKKLVAEAQRVAAAITLR